MYVEDFFQYQVLLDKGNANDVVAINYSGWKKVSTLSGQRNVKLCSELKVYKSIYNKYYKKMEKESRMKNAKS